MEKENKELDKEERIVSIFRSWANELKLRLREKALDKKAKGDPLWYYGVNDQLILLAIMDELCENVSDYDILVRMIDHLLVLNNVYRGEIGRGLSLENEEWISKLFGLQYPYGMTRGEELFDDMPTSFRSVLEQCRQKKFKIDRD